MVKIFKNLVPGKDKDYKIQLYHFYTISPSICETHEITGKQKPPLICQTT